MAGCGSTGKDERVAGSTLTVYESLPLHGTSARAADAVSAGARLALSDVHASAGGRRVRLVELDSSDPNGGPTWDPSMVEANAKRAAADPTTIAYLGELDQGGSAISVPVTNDKNILQVAPLDGLTSLTQPDPSTPAKTGPERYDPSGRRNFLRLAPSDITQAGALVDWARQKGATSIALVQDEHLFGREVAAQAALAASRAHVVVTDQEEARGDPTGYPDLALKLAQKHPGAVIYTGVGDPASGTLLAALARAMPGTPLIGSSALAGAAPTPPGLPPVDVLDPVLPPREYPPSARKVLRRLSAQRGAPVDAAALYGYEAMRLVIDALNAAGRESDDRGAVVRAALRPRTRRSVLGTFMVLASVDVAPMRFAEYHRTGGSLSYEGVRESPVEAVLR